MFANGPADYEVVKEIAKLTQSIHPGKSVRAVAASFVRALTSLRQEAPDRPIVRNFQGNVFIVRKGDPQ